MAVINKDLYDALRAANVGDELATKAATSSDSALKEDVAVIKVRLAMVEKLHWVVVIGMLVILLKNLFA